MQDTKLSCFVWPNEEKYDGFSGFKKTRVFYQKPVYPRIFNVTFICFCFIVVVNNKNRSGTIKTERYSHSEGDNDIIFKEKKLSFLKIS